MQHITQEMQGHWNEFTDTLRHHYADFSGRTDRRAYWLYSLISSVIVILLELPALSQFMAVARQLAEGGTPAAGGAVIGSADQVLAPSAVGNWLMMPTTLVSVLFPSGASGSWLLLPATVVSLLLVIPSLSIMVRRLHDTGRSAWWCSVSFIPFVGSFAFLLLLTLPSEPGTNRWGEATG